MGMTMAIIMGTDIIMSTIMDDGGDRASFSLPPRSGGEGRRAPRKRRASGWGESSSPVQVSPPTPDPSPPLTSFAGGGEERETAGKKEASAQASAHLLRLMAWLSPAFPVGAFSYSSGIEWAVEAGDITDADTLKDWLSVMLTAGGGYCDAVLFAHAHRAVMNGDGQALRDIAELAAAFAPSKERHLETTAQGNAFIEAARAAWPCEALDRLKSLWDGPVAYPVAVAVTAAGHGIALAEALPAYLHALTANWVSAGVRLIPLGQTDSQHVIHALEADVQATARRALNATVDDLGGAAFRADLASVHHETQYTRLFRS